MVTNIFTNTTIPILYLNNVSRLFLRILRINIKVLNRYFTYVILFILTIIIGATNHNSIELSQI